MSRVKQLLFFLSLNFLCLALTAQTDSLSAVLNSVRARDTFMADTAQPPVRRVIEQQVPIIKQRTPAPVDTFRTEISKRRLFSNEWKLDSTKNFTGQIMNHHPYFGFDRESVVIRTDKRMFRGKEVFFYVIILLLLMYALLKTAFPKYFNDLFRLFFRTTIKQRQIKEQLMQTPLPSVLLNGFFAISAGMYLAFLLEHFNLNPVGSFWLLFLYCILGLSGIYLIKFLSLKLTGWIFQIKDAVDAYIFIVFIINKMAGLLLLPFLVLLAFTTGGFYSIALTLSYFVLAILLAYRFILTYTVVRNQVRVNPFHFFLYLCAFEIAPLLLVYKLLLIYFGISS